MEGLVRIGFLIIGNDAVIGQGRMGDDFYIPLGHMATSAVVRWLQPPPGLQGEDTTGIRVATHAFPSVIRGRIWFCWLDVRIMAGKATQFAVTPPIAFA